MTGEGDWRLTWEADWMYGAELRLRAFKAPTEDWDHDHCSLCWETFSETDPDVLKEGYVLEDDSPSPILPVEERTTTYPGGYRMVTSPTEEWWICPVCFEEFRERFGWSAL